MIQVGLFIKKYEILKKISGNNMSAEYLAIDIKLNKPCIIKEIYKANKEGVIPFRQKLIAKRETLCNLSHPNLPRIVDIIDEEDLIIIVLDYIEGKTLDIVLKESGPLSQDCVIDLAKQMCSALEYLHSKANGIFCGNIRPSKMVLKDDGNIVLLDFFIITDYDDKKFLDTVCLGTSEYLAPEQLPRTKVTDARTDIYALGAVVGKLLTGQNLCESQNKIRAIREFNLEISDRLEEIIEKCTQPSPGDRYQSAKELMFALSDKAYLGQHLKKRKTIDTLLHPLKSLSKKNSRKKKSVDSIKNVRFSALAPKNFMKGEYTMVEIVMYEEEYKNIVIQSRIKDEIDETTTGYVEVIDQPEVSICLTSPDVEVIDNTETLTWCGKYLKFQFVVYLPIDYDKKQLLFNATVYFNNVIATKIKFIAKCSSERKQKMKVFREDVLSAFVSYASEDRNEVSLIIQGMRKSRPDMEIFFDIDSLRSGEKWEQILIKEIRDRDIFFLCWSHFAKESKWVNAEWRYALSSKGIDSIEPIPLEPTSVCPPPKELESKHFNDREIYYRTNNYSINHNKK